MSDQRDTYETTKVRLEEIAAAAKAKDVTLEKSIELLEEAVRLANLCTEHVDQVDTFSAAPPEGEGAGEDADAASVSSDGPQTDVATGEAVADASEVVVFEAAESEGLDGDGDADPDEGALGDPEPAEADDGADETGRDAEAWE